MWCAMRGKQMWYNDDRITIEDILAVVAGTLCVGAIIFAIWMGHKHNEAKCLWEHNHGIESYDCRNWEK